MLPTLIMMMILMLKMPKMSHMTQPTLMITFKIKMRQTMLQKLQIRVLMLLCANCSPEVLAECEIR